METSTRKFRRLTGLVIVLFTLNVATVISLIYHARQEKNRTTTRMDDNRSAVIAEQGARFFREQLKLDPDQTDQFREINREYNRSVNVLAFDLEKLRREMVDAMAEDKPDTAHLYSISHQIGVRHEKIKNITIDYYLKMKSVCSEKQQDKLYSIFLDRVQKEDSLPSNQGRGKGPRWRGGRN